jgi:heat shock protein HslJ
MKITFSFILLLFLFSCKTTAPSNTGNNGTTTSGNATSLPDKNMQDRGIDLTAVGSIPVNWRMEMNFDDTVRFSADDGLDLRFAFHKLTGSVAVDSKTYAAQINGGQLLIVIEEKDCTVPTIRQSFNKAVTVTYRSKTYNGCGKFVVNEALNGKWMLEKIGTTAILPEEYNRIPVLQFDLAAQKVSGNDGCNTIGGNIEVQGNRIQFSSLFSTKMACMKKSIEKIIARHLSDKLVSWYFRNEKLYLYLEDDSLLVFKKA